MKPYLWTAVILILVWETFSLLPPRNLPPVEKDPFHANYVMGIIHVHSTFSDGGGTPRQIATAANEAGMDFVVLTDHNNSKARKAGDEKAYGGLDLYVEMEATTPAGHCLSFFSTSSALTLADPVVDHLSWDHFLGTDTRPNMFVVIAHPSNVKNPWNRLDRFPDGIEVVNFDSVWQRELNDSTLDFLGTVFTYPFNNYLAALRFFQIYPKDFSAWDAMTSVSKGHFGILAHDTHDKLKLNNSLSLPWPSYLQTFKLASNVIFLGEPRAKTFEERKEQTYRALRAGRIAMVFHSIFPFPGNDWKTLCNGKLSRPGDDALLSAGNCQFVVNTPTNLPYKKQIRIYRNGDVYSDMTTNQSEVTIPVHMPGTYRVEVWVKAHTALRFWLNRDVPYVFYNPIYVR